MDKIERINEVLPDIRQLRMLLITHGIQLISLKVIIKPGTEETEIKINGDSTTNRS